MASSEKITIRHNATKSRYEAAVDGRLALRDYLLENGRMIFTHTYVPPELRSRGIAGMLVRQALDEAAAANRRVVPACSYVAAFGRRHPEYQSLFA